MDNKKNIDGWLNLIKPAGISSSKALDCLRKYFKGVKKVGHIGTLDPFASGVLPVAIGEATKTIEYISKHKKTYIVEIEWGFETDTLDSEGSVIKRVEDFSMPNLEKIRDVLRSFIGIFDQMPPQFSAKKIEGKRAYQLARKNIEFTLTPKKVECFGIEIVSYNEKQHLTKLRIDCGKGFYIRSLVRDLALKLGTFATAKSLHRKSDGIFFDNNGITLALLKKMLYDNPSALERCLLGVTSVLDDIPVCEVDSKSALALKNGLKINVLVDLAKVEGLSFNSLMKACYRNFPIAICEICSEAHLSLNPEHSGQVAVTIKPIKGFNLVDL